MSDNLCNVMTYIGDNAFTTCYIILFQLCFETTYILLYMIRHCHHYQKRTNCTWGGEGGGSGGGSEANASILFFKTE